VQAIIGIHSCLEHLPCGDASTFDVEIQKMYVKPTADKQQTASMANGARYSLQKDDSGIQTQTKRMLNPEHSLSNKGSMMVHLLVPFRCSFLIRIIQIGLFSIT
jgi:hypothetical protein